MKIQQLSRKPVFTKSRTHDPQLGLVRFLLIITGIIVVIAVYATFR
ncbi:hypothetical protein [Flavobacterium magnum]|nr:hypothetical protein [Flavobacterium magnum]